MNKSKIIRCFMALMLLSFCMASCDSFVDGVDPLSSQVDDDRLNTEAQFPFLITGLLGAYGISDEGDGVPWLICGFEPLGLKSPQRKSSL